MLLLPGTAVMLFLSAKTAFNNSVPSFLNCKIHTLYILVSPNLRISGSVPAFVSTSIVPGTLNRNWKAHSSPPPDVDGIISSLLHAPSSKHSIQNKLILILILILIFSSSLFSTNGICHIFYFREFQYAQCQFCFFKIPKELQGKFKAIGHTGQESLTSGSIEYKMTGHRSTISIFIIIYR